MKRNAFFVLLPFAAVALLGLGFVACDTGDSPPPPTGPGSVYDPLFDDPQPGVTARVSPSTLTVPDPITDDIGKTTLVGYYRDPDGNPQQGLQMNFTADPVNPNITFNPPAAFTGTNGGASTEVQVAKTVPEGSYTLVAFTSPASGGPNAKGYATLGVNVGEIVTTPNIPSGNTAPVDQDNLTTGVFASADYSTGGSTSNLGNDIQYRFDCGGELRTWLPVGNTTDTCTFNSAGTKSVRAQARSENTLVESEWSGALTVTVDNIFP